jgi:hypothetical protein
MTSDIPAPDAQAGNFAQVSAEKAALVRTYMETYPEEHVDGEVALFAIKSGNGEVANLINTWERPYTRNQLGEVLELSTYDEICYVGW